MKRILLKKLCAGLLCMAALTACNSDETLGQTDIYQEISVTVSGNELSGYRLYTDFDVVFSPTNLSQIPQLKAVERAIISFTLDDESLTLDQLQEGRTYGITLYPSYCYERPTFNNLIDTSDISYIENAGDSIAQKKKSVQSVDRTEGLFYVKNGYLNLNATFAYSASTPVRFSLYYDGEQDVDTENGKLTLHLYFNNDVESPEHTTTSPLSFRLNELLRSRFLSAGFKSGDTIEVCLKVPTVSDNEVQLTTQMQLTDFSKP